MLRTLDRGYDKTGNYAPASPPETGAIEPVVGFFDRLTGTCNVIDPALAKVNVTSIVVPGYSDFAAGARDRRTRVLAEDPVPTPRSPTPRPRVSFGSMDSDVAPAVIGWPTR